MDTQKEYPKGIYWNEKHPKQPDFVLGKVAVKRKEAVEWLETKSDEYVYLQLLNGKDKKYFQVDNYKKNDQFDNTNMNKKIEVEPKGLEMNDIDYGESANVDDIPF